MPRRNRRSSGSKKRDGSKGGSAPRPLPSFGSSFQSTRTEAGPGRLSNEDFHVRNISSGQATKWYRCPGCDQEIPPGVAHVVAWPVEYGGRADDRRHWHTNCWGKRAHRGITRRWS
ncbi:ATP/GTP-binding protein [Corynebacterium sp. H113]|uniref:ATP/GTP-binding protein n=1 Tax=Corynebacterium sp. H113 TaxID=3133419 RepID=UPI0030B26E81